MKRAAPEDDAATHGVIVKLEASISNSDGLLVPALISNVDSDDDAAEREQREAYGMKREATDDDAPDGVIVKLEEASNNSDGPLPSVWVHNDDSADDEAEIHAEGQATGVTAALLEASQSRGRCSSGTRSDIVAHALQSSEVWGEILTSEHDPALVDPAVVTGLGAQRTAGRHQAPAPYHYLVRTTVSQTEEPDEYDLSAFCAYWLISIFISCGHGVTDFKFSSILRSIFRNLVLFAVGACTLSLLSSATLFTPDSGVQSFPMCDGTCIKTPRAHLSCIRCFRGYGRYITLQGLQRICKDKCFQTTSLTFATIDSVLQSGPSLHSYPATVLPCSALSSTNCSHPNSSTRIPDSWSPSRPSFLFPPSLPAVPPR
jgi:hypothetical protein